MSVGIVHFTTSSDNLKAYPYAVHIGEHVVTHFQDN